MPVFVFEARTARQVLSCEQENQFCHTHIEWHTFKTRQVGFAFLEFKRSHRLQGASCCFKQLDLPVL